MWAAVLGGVLVGLVLGALGGGGSILAVPIFVYGLHQDPHEATTSSLVVVAVTSLVALVPYVRRGEVRVGRGLAFAFLGVMGSWVGVRAASRIDGDVLLGLFGALLAVVAVLLGRRALHSRPTATSGEGVGRVSRVRMIAAASLVGALTGFFGVGGGFAVVSALVLVLRTPMRVAAGTSLVVIAVNSTLALALRGVDGPTQVHLTDVAVVTAAAVCASVAGARFGARLPQARLQLGFAALLAAVSLTTLSQVALATW